MLYGTETALAVMQSNTFHMNRGFLDVNMEQEEYPELCNKFDLK